MVEVNEVDQIGIELAIARPVFEYMARDAGLRGVTVEELIRWYLGDLARSETLYPSGLRPAQPLPDSMADSEKTMASQLEFAEQFAKFHMAAAGALDCEECTQKINCADVRRNKCSHCQAAVLSDPDDDQRVD